MSPAKLKKNVLPGSPRQVVINLPSAKEGNNYRISQDTHRQQQKNTAQNINTQPTPPPLTAPLPIATTPQRDGMVVVATHRPTPFPIGTERDTGDGTFVKFPQSTNRPEKRKATPPHKLSNKRSVQRKTQQASKHATNYLGDLPA